MEGGLGKDFFPYVVCSIIKAVWAGAGGCLVGLYILIIAWGGGRQGGRQTGRAGTDMVARRP